MNRRSFIQSLAAVVSIPLGPSLSLQPAVATAVPAAGTVPTQARFWAIYMSGLHGECTPQTLQAVLNISASDAKKYVTQLVTDGIIKPNPLMQKSVAEFARTAEEKLLDMSAEADEAEPVEDSVEAEDVDLIEPQPEALEELRAEDEGEPEKDSPTNNVS